MTLEQMVQGSDYSDILLELESGNKYDLGARELKFDSKNNTVTFYIEVFQSEFFTELTNNIFTIGTWETIKNIQQIIIDDIFFLAIEKTKLHSAGTGVGVVKLRKEELMDISWCLTSFSDRFIMEFEIKAKRPIKMTRVIL